MTKNRVKKSAEKKIDFTQNIALIAAEEFALSIVPLLMAANEAGGVAKAISILKKAKEDEKL